MPLLGTEKPVTPPTYTIYQHGPNYYADPSIESGKTRLSGTVAQSVIQAAFNNLTAGRTWKEKVVLKGNLTISDTIKLPSYAILQIEGKLSLANNVNKNMIENSDPTNGNTAIDIIGGMLDGNKANQASGHGIKFVYVRYRSSIINLWVQYCKEDGVHLDDYKCNVLADVKSYDNNGNGVYGINLADVLFDVLAQGNAGAGIRLAYSGHCIINGHLSHNGYGVMLGASDDNCVSANVSANTSDGVYLFSDADENIIHGSRAEGNGGYGVNILTADCDYTLVHGNILLGNTGGALNNAGAGNAIIKNNVGYVTENSETATFSGTGAQTSFVIAHGLVSTPKMAVVTAGSSDARGDFYVTYNATNITVTYATAPPAGTNNVVLRWYAEV